LIASHDPGPRGASGSGPLNSSLPVILSFIGSLARAAEAERDRYIERYRERNKEKQIENTERYTEQRDT